MENITIMLPTENSGVDRNLILEDDGEILQISFCGRNDKQKGGI